MDRTHAEARARIPMAADQVRAYIATMERETRSKVARIKLAEAAIRLGNITPEGKDAYRDYLAELRG
jgi:hypothetical protein